MLEFPEAYFDAAGQPLPTPASMQCIGNPPWDMLRAAAREDVRPNLRRLSASGAGPHQPVSDVRRARADVDKRGGRIGLVLPSGFATDHTSAPLRRTLLSRTNVDTISGFDNRRAIFPIHRSVRFLICTSTVGEATRHIACRFGIDDPAELETIPDGGDRPRRSHPIALTPSFLEALSGHTFAIPELRTRDRPAHPRARRAQHSPARRRRRLERAVRPRTERDRRSRPFSQRGGQDFRCSKESTSSRFARMPIARRCESPNAARRRLLDAAATFSRARLAYRDVASSTNRLSLIAAVLPPESSRRIRSSV